MRTLPGHPAQRRNYPFADFNQIQNRDFQPGFFFELPFHSLLEALAYLKHAARYGPLAFQRLGTTPGEQNPAILYHDSTHSENRAGRIFSVSCHHFMSRIRTSMPFSSFSRLTRAAVSELPK